MSEIILNQILTELKEIKHEQAVTNQRIDGLDKRIETMDKRIDGLDKRIEKIDKRIDDNTSRLDSLTNTVNIIHDQTVKLTEYHLITMEALKRLASKDDVDYLIDKVGEHDREIYKLKNNRENQTPNE